MISYCLGSISTRSLRAVADFGALISLGTVLVVFAKWVQLADKARESRLRWSRASLPRAINDGAKSH
jgi:hypothetical protein